MNLVKTLPPSTIYARQKAMAKVRNIGWELTFEEWWNIWEQSGKYEQRGRGAGKYCMSRKNDVGSYAVGNIYIQTIDDNNREAKAGKPRNPIAVEKTRQKFIGVKHSDERKLANSLGQKNSKKNVFTNKIHSNVGRTPWNKGKKLNTLEGKPV